MRSAVQVCGVHEVCVVAPRVRQLAQPVGQRRQVGANLTGDGPFESAAFRVTGGDQPTSGLGELVGAEAELLDLARQFGAQRRVAEGQSCLAGKLPGDRGKVPASQR